MRAASGRRRSRIAVLSLVATALIGVVAASVGPVHAAFGPAGPTALRADARITLDAAGGAPVAGREFLVVAAVESHPFPTGPPFTFAVTVMLPSGVQFLSASRGQPVVFQCQGTGQTITCGSRHIGADHTSQVSLVLRAARAGTYTVHASVAVVGDSDSNPADNAAELTVDVAAPPAVAACIVPNVGGKLLAAARRAIANAGCRVGTVRNAWSSRVRRGRVIRQSPPAGKRVQRGTKVSLVVSRGPHPQ